MITFLAEKTNQMNFGLGNRVPQKKIILNKTFKEKRKIKGR